MDFALFIYIVGFLFFSKGLNQMNEEQKKRVGAIVFSIFFAFVGTTILWILLFSSSGPSNPPEDYLGHWALNKKSYLIIKKDNSRNKMDEDVELEPDYDADLVLPVKVKGKIVLELPWPIPDLDFWVNGRGGIYVAGGKHVLKVENDCTPMVLRRDGANLEVGYSNGGRYCEFTPKNLTWVKYWTTKRKKKKK